MSSDPRAVKGSNSPDDRVESKSQPTPTGLSPRKYVLWGALAMSLLLNGMAVVHYDIMQKVMKRIDEWRRPIPDVSLNIKPFTLSTEPAIALPEGELSAEELSEWRLTARDKLAELLSVDFPVATPQVRALSRETVDDVTRELCIISQPDGMQTPAFLLRPTGSPPFAGIVLIPGHSRGIVATAGIVDDYQHGNALALAKAGYVVLTFEVRGLGYLRYMPTQEGVIDLDSHVGARLIEGRSAIGVTVTDAESAIEFLAHHPDVDPSRLGVVGFSSGGTAAIFLAALDERVKALVASGCVGSFSSRYLFSRHDSYEAVAGITKFLEMSDCLAMIAPRPVLSHWGALDDQPQKRTAAYNASSLSTWAAAQRAYKVLDAVEDFEKCVSKNMGHEFDNGAAVEFLHRHLPVRH